MTSVELKNVSFSYPNGFKAVDNVSMKINKGDKIAIVGQNGAGKTTTVKMMNGLLRPSEGEVFVNGKNTEDLTTAQISRKVGYVFQNSKDQIFNATVYEEIAYALRAFNLDEEEVDRRVRDAAKLCYVEEYLEDNPYDLPTSFMKFVTIAIVIANDCETIILDEPTAGLDLFEKSWLENIMEEVLSRGKTLIIITHDMDFVVKNFKDVLVMANKELIKEGTPNQVFGNEEVLERAYLKKPTIAQLATNLGLGDNIISIDEFIERIGGANLE